MRAIFVTMLTLALAGCNGDYRMSKAVWDAAESLCAHNGGLVYASVEIGAPTHFVTSRCKDNKKVLYNFSPDELRAFGYNPNIR